MATRVKWENLRGDKFAGVVLETDSNELVVHCDDGKVRGVDFRAVVTDEPEPKRVSLPGYSE